MIEVKGLTRQFDSRIAVEDLSLEVGQGEIFGLLGPNGAGKTTTLRMLAGLISPSSGEATVAGVPLVRERMNDVRAKVGFLTEAPGLWDRLTVRLNLLVYARLYGVDDPARAVSEALGMFDLEDRADSLAAQLSKGMKQKVAIARALLHSPPVLLLDEPTSGLDPQTARLVRELVLALRDRGHTIIISTHNLDEAERVSSRIGVLQRRLIALDTPDALRRRLFGQRVRVRLAGGTRDHAEAAVQAFIFQQFMLLQLLIPVTGAMAFAGYSLIGEKQGRTLEPLLATPITTAELLIAKGLGALLPSLAIMLGTLAIYLAGMLAFAEPHVFSAVLTARAALLVLGFGPIGALVALQIAILVSARVNDPRTAQQFGALLILPITVAFVMQFNGVIRLTVPVIVIALVVLFVVWVLLVMLGVALFEREAILTRWK